MNKKTYQKFMAFICSICLFASSCLPIAAEAEFDTNIQNTEEAAENFDETEISEEIEDTEQADITQDEFYPDMDFETEELNDSGEVYSNNDDIYSDEEVPEETPLKQIISADDAQIPDRVKSVPMPQTQQDETAELFDENPFPLTIEKMGHKKDPWSESMLAVSDTFVVYANTNGTITPMQLNNNSDSPYIKDGYIDNFIDVRQLAVSDDYIAAIRNNGTVYASRPKKSDGLPPEKTIWDWSDIAQISTTPRYIIALKNNGTADWVKVAENSGVTNKDGFPNDIAGWNNLVKVSACDKNAVGLTADGKVVNTVVEYNMTDKYGADCAEWENIIDVIATSSFTVALTADKTIKISDATNKDYGLNVADKVGAIRKWENIKKIAAYSNSSYGYILGLKEDGSVLISSSNTPFGTSYDSVASEISEWRNIEEIYAAKDYVLAKQTNGTYVYVTTDRNKTAYLEKLNSIEEDPHLEISYAYTKDETLGYDICRLNIKNLYETDISNTKFDLNLIEGYDENNKPMLIPIENDENGYTYIKEDNSPIRITEEGTYDIMVMKEGVPSRFKQSASVVRDDFIAQIVPDTPSFVSETKTDTPSEMSFRAEYNGEKTDAYDLKYSDIYKGSTTDYTADEKISIPGSMVYDLYGELKDSKGEEVSLPDGTKTRPPIKTDVVTRKYFFFTSPVEYNSYYPSPCYPMTENDYNKLAGGKLMRKTNIVKSVSSDNLTLVLKTNGTVQGAFKNDSPENDIKNAIVGTRFNMSRFSNNSNSQASSTTFADTDYSCVGNWRMISDIAVGNKHTLGLRHDGTVIAAGSNQNGQCNVSDWDDIAAVAAGSYHSVALTSDGYVIAKGLNDNNQCDVSTWNDIYAIAARNNYTVGLKRDGTIYFTGDESNGQNPGVQWNDKNIVNISAGTNTLMGLKGDGTVIFKGENDSALNEGSKDWRNIVYIAAGANLFIGIDIDGYIHYVYNKSAISDIAADGDIKGSVRYISSDGTKWETEDKYHNGAWNDWEKHIAIFAKLNNLIYGNDTDIKKVKYIAAAVGDHTMTLVTEDGYVLNAIFDNPLTTAGALLSDDRFPIIANAYSINGPTIINNYLSGEYSYDDLKIRLDSTTSKRFNLKYTKKANDNPETQGLSYTSTFSMRNADGDNVLRIIPESSDSDQTRDAMVTYYYNFKDPEIQSLAIPRKDSNGNIVMDITFSSTVSGSDIYYLISTPPPVPTQRPGTTPDPAATPAQSTPKPITSDPNNSSSSTKYTGTITIDTPAIIKAVAYIGTTKSNNISTFNFAIPETIENGGYYLKNDEYEITKDTTWKKENSPYILQQSLKISSGATLTIEPGVTVKCGYDVKINAGGSLNAVGTDTEPITFERFTTYNWAGIDFITGTNDFDKNNAFSNINITGANDGLLLSAPVSTFKDASDNTVTLSNINIERCKNVLNINSSGYNIKNCKFNNNSGIAASITDHASNTSFDNCEFNQNKVGIDISGNDVSVTNSKIINNSDVGIKASGKVSVCHINNNEIYDNLLNVRTDIVSSPATTILDFKNNYWRNYTEPFIRKTINDYLTTQTFSKVDIDGFDTSRKADYERVEVSLPKTQTGELFSPANAASANRIIFDVSDHSPNISFIVALYGENNLLLKTYIAKANDNNTVNITAEKTNDVKSVKVFAWDINNNLDPMLKPIEIN